jgi:phospholipase C
MSDNDKIKHVVVLMLENRSFDQMLGCMKEVYPQLEGVDIANNPHSCPDYPDRTHEIAQLNFPERRLDPDPKHEHTNVMRQVAPACGFVEDYVQAYPYAFVDLGEKAAVMGIYPRGFLYALHTLAEHFAICDHWYSSVPGPTWPNRFFVHSGTSKGHVKMPNGVFDKNWHLWDQVTLYDRLEEKKISWKIYHHGMPQSLAMVRLWKYADNFCAMDQFFEDAKGGAEAFPQYAFIEPCYSGPGQNDQHPPSDVMAGELLLARVYNALRENADLWAETLFVFLYDEHGGFYDHVTKLPPATPPDNFVHPNGFAFDELGLRVPALLISPWIDRGVVNTPFDHTSLLKYLTDKWGLGPLGARTADAASFGSELEKRTAPRTDCPAALDLTKIPAVIPNDSLKINPQQRALISFSHLLEEELSKLDEPVNDIVDRTIRILGGAEKQFEVAKERFDRFFEHKKNGANGPTNA